MRKLAVVVEGQTESLLVERMVQEIAGRHRVRVQRMRAVGGTRLLRSVTPVATEPDNGQSFYVLIYDSSTDSRVASDICENYDGWVREGFVGIFGLRDVYPNPHIQLDTLRRQASFRQKTKPLRVQNLFAVMEIESWFVAEVTHFLRMHEALSREAITASVGFDPWRDSIEERRHPSEDLHQIYKLANLAYRKSKRSVQRTLEALSYEHLLLDAVARAPSLSHLVDLLDQFFGGASWNDEIPPLRVA